MLERAKTDFSPESEYFYASEGPAYPSNQRPAIGIADILRTLRRDWWFPVFGSLIGLTVAVSYIVFVPSFSLYKSSVRILLDRGMNRYLQTNKLVDQPIFDDADIGSQVHILSSESIVVPVVRSMNLASDSEFVGPSDALGPRILWKIDSILKVVKQSVGLDGDDAKIDTDAIRERIAVETFLKRLSIDREDVPNVINVSFASEDANKAANIANAVADTYIASGLEAKSNSTKMASQWLQDRLMELKGQAADADRALQDYKIANKLVDTGKGLLNAEQLAALNNQLANARTALVEAKARLDRIQQQSSEEIPSANNELIVRLRSEYLELATKATELASRVGPKHLAVVRLHERMDNLRTTIRAAIQDEQKRTADSYASEYQIAKVRESELAATMARLVGEAGVSSQAQVTMRDLESSADSLRNLYNSFTQKFLEMNTVGTQTIPVQDARILTRAAPPLHIGGSKKKAVVVLAGGIMLGLFLGTGAAIGREWTADVFRTPDVVKQVTDINCLILPTVKTSPEQTGSTKAMFIEEFVLDAPYSRFTETLRNVKVLINPDQLENGAKIIGVVSSVPKEGKTTVAANLAALMVASSGARTLLIDGDLHLRRLTTKLAPDARQGLLEALLDSSQLSTFVCKRPRSGLDFLPCILSARIPNAAELLGSHLMKQLLDAAREAYDYIIIEVAPIMSVVDFKVMKRFIDRFIFVVEWGHTKRSLVLEALSEAQIIRERLIGIVLNKADPHALRVIEAYKGDRFRDYYQG
jgi:succinoglycan biosynthesis transport protein ExoP